ncbi:DUF3549 family protein [Vibrio metschnikovii]|uniref:DUF3549 family protein n=1 Tax=Vibrio metschnikovii TaxID=28172 RepID=UPI0016464CF9|nr:DUF3549 family protein [Vibrio metschnikovii]MBC3620341.1 DUF3549 family protein [Vibrio metschnikovii]
MQPIHTLTDLLQQSEVHYQIFDLGRRIQPVDAQQFHHVEQARQPYPYPLQRQAHLAIVYWHQHQQPWIWFVKFNLDERGLLAQAEIGQFLSYVLEAMGSRLTGELTEAQQQKLANNPYTFKPSEEKMAVIHSQIRRQLSLPSSQYYEHAQHYLTGDLGWDNWQSVGLQGISDICARLNDSNNSQLIINAIPHLPSPVLYALLGALEHNPLPDNLALALEEQLQTGVALPEYDLFLLAALIRALSGGTQAQLDRRVDQLLDNPSRCHPEVLIAIAGRCWSALKDPGRAQRFLLRLAQSGDQTLFNQIFADLVMLPELRVVLLPLLHSSPSSELTQALVNLQRATKPSSP